MIDFNNINNNIDKRLAKKIISNKNIYNKFLDFDNNIEYFNYISKEDYIVYIVNYIKKTLACDSTNIQYKVIAIYEQFLKELFIDEPYLIFHNPLIDYIKEMNIEEEKIKTDNLNRYIKSFFKRFSECKQNFENYKNLIYKGKIDNDNFKKYVCYVNNTGYTEEIYNYVFNKIIEFNYHIDKSDYVDLIKKFTGYVCSDIGIDNVEVKITELEESTYASYLREENNDSILFNSIYFKIENIIPTLCDIFHETHHLYQFQKTELYNYDHLKYIKDDLLRDKYGDEYYNKNYWYVSCESDAICTSYVCLKKYLSMVAPKKFNEIIKDFQNTINAWYLRRQDNNRVTNTKVYTLDELFNDLMMNDSYIAKQSKYSEIISLEYNEDNTRKTALDFFKEKYKCLSELMTIPFNEENKLNELNNKINFYNDMLNYSDYTLDELKYNYLLLDNYYGENKEMIEEIFQYKTLLLSKIKELENTNIYTLEVNQKVGDTYGRSK